MKWIPWLPALAAVLCGVCCCKKSLRPAAAWVCITSLLAAFVITWLTKGQVDTGIPGIPGVAGQVVPFFEWIRVDGFVADFSYYIDSLTVVMLLVVTGIGTLVAIYAAGLYVWGKGLRAVFRSCESVHFCDDDPGHG